MEEAVKDSERDILFARARSAASPTDEDRRRVRAALARQIGVTAAVTVSATAVKTAAGAVPAASAAGAGLSTAVVVKMAVAIVAVSAVLGGAVPALRARTSASPAVPVATATVARDDSKAKVVEALPVPARSPGSQAQVETPASQVAALAGEHEAVSSRVGFPVAPAVLAPAPRSTPDEPSPAASSTRDTAVEISLVARMQAALRDGDTQAVLSLVAEHERMFPESKWAEERDGARVLALCAHAESHEAHRLGQTFLSVHPLSPLGGRVRATCGLDNQGR
jgi:hypothetical protein